jgi:hypothetical protein
MFDHVVAVPCGLSWRKIEQWLPLDLPPQKAVPGTE